VETGLKEKQRKTKFFVIIGIIFMFVLISWGIYHHEHNEIKVVQAKYENGIDKEVWVFKKHILGNKQKIKELTYYDNGNKESNINYKNGKVNGLVRMWYKNGKLHVEAQYKNNKTHGTRISYHENGQVFCRAEYNNGELLQKRNWDEKGNEIYLPIDRE
jgi:antitoxin component YwqK of YwqJK toxin-antitoxin module